MKFMTKHLSSEYGFVTLRKTDNDDIDCGKIRPDGSSTCRWPRMLGPEPTWFDTEVNTLQVYVQEHFDNLNADARDYRAQVDADYLRGKGAR